MSYITVYSANSRQFLVPVTGSRNLSSVVYGDLKNAFNIPVKIELLNDLPGKK